MNDSFDIRNSAFGLLQVRHSKFVIRHCPDPHDATGRFDFVLANPPFDVNAVGDANGEVRNPRCEVGPIRQSTFVIRHSRRLWIRLFHSALNEKGRAGFEVVNSTRIAHSCSMNLSEGVCKYAAELGIAEERSTRKTWERSRRSSCNKARSLA